MHNDLYKALAKAKPTVFDDRVYRSRSEAKWAAVLTYLAVPFYYEPAHYRLESGLYLPDYWLPTLDAYLEVKPCDVSDPRYGELGEMRGKRVFVVSGDMPYIPAGWAEDEVYPNLAGHIWLKWPDDEPDYMLAAERQGRINIVPLAYSSAARGNDPRILNAYLSASTYPYREVS